MKITRAVVPSLFTVLNMFCGFLSIVNSSEGRFDTAGWFVLLAGVFDALDGVMARITKSSSEFGVEFDSLSDVVSFGAAPAFLVYRVHLYQLEGVGLLLSSLLVILGGVRLARFNVQLIGFDKEHFIGLPIPMAAITVVSYVMTFRSDISGLDGIAGDALVPLVIVVSLLMVSRVKYDTLPKLSKREIRKHPVRFAAFLIAGLTVVATAGRALFYVFAFFLLLGILRGLYEWLRRLLGIVDTRMEEEEGEEATSFDI